MRVLVNLVSNAAKYSPAGSEVQVKVTEEGYWRTFFVIDQGRGIPVDKQNSIFDKYKQVEADDSRKLGGIGLGLPISKAIVTAHHGIIGVQSEPGKGSRFWFKIPAGNTSHYSFSDSDATLSDRGTSSGL